MKTLPDRASPPAAIPRRHSPKPGAYERYRDCLRWEFGFTCPFCLSHEADLVSHGAAGSGLMTIEHRVPRSDPARGTQLTDVYANCYYACRFCNRARDTRPITDGAGRRLLDPITDAWSSHFERHGHELHPAPNDADAEYTTEAYDLNDPRKKAVRRERELTLRTARRAEAALCERVARVETALAKHPEASLVLLLRDLRDDLERASRDLTRYAVSPADAPGSCRCATISACSLPPHAGA